MDQFRDYDNIKLNEWRRAGAGVDDLVRFRYIQVRQKFWLVDLALNVGWFADRIKNNMFTFTNVSNDHFNILNDKRGTWRGGVNMTVILT